MGATASEDIPILNGNPSSVQAVHHVGGLHMATTVVFLVGEMVGMGVLALPKSLAHSGWAGVTLLVLASLVSGYNGVRLGMCWTMLLERYPEFREHIRYPYAAIAEKAVAKWMSYLVSFSMIFTLMGSCVLFLILSSQNIHSILEDTPIDISFCIWMIIIAVILTPFTWFGSPKDFWWLSILAAGSAVLGCFILFVTLMTQLPLSSDAVHEFPSSFTSYFLAFGAILFAYGGASTFPTIQHDMKDPSKFKIAAGIAFAVLLAVYVPTAVAGYYVYGTAVNANILKSLPRGGLRISAEVLFTSHLVFAFVILLNPVLQDLEESIKIPNVRFHWKRVLFRTGVMVFILFMAESFPHFGAVLDFVGGSTVTFLTFVAPPLFYVCLCRKFAQFGDHSRQLTTFATTFNIVIVIVGILGGIASTYSAVLELSSKNTFVPPCYVNATAAAESG